MTAIPCIWEVSSGRAWITWSWVSDVRPVWFSRPQFCVGDEVWGVRAQAKAVGHIPSFVPWASGHRPGRSSVPESPCGALLRC